MSQRYCKILKLEVGWAYEYKEKHFYNVSYYNIFNSFADM